jgi:general stress protein 26
MKPAPEPVDPAKLPETARETMRRAKYPMMGTAGVDGAPRVRPVSPVKTEGFTVWVASLRRYGKTAEIEANPRVELCYLDEGHDQVRIAGRAVRIGPGAELQAIWDSNPLMRSFLGSIDNPELIVYRIVPERVRFMREWALDYHEVSLGEG